MKADAYGRRQQAIAEDLPYVWLVYLETLNALPADWPRRRPRPAWPALPAHHRRTTRRRVGLVFQDALSSFDPRYTVGQVVAEALPKSRSHEGWTCSTGLD